MLCPGQHGAFKQTVNGQWAHLLCAIWINETWVSNTVYMEPIDGIESIPKQRWRLICNLCKKRAGACIQCSKGSCYTAYHVTCAREQGLYLKLGTNSGATTTDGSGGANISYCDKHSRQAFGEEEDEERAISEELREGRPKKRKLIPHGNIGRDDSEDPDQAMRTGRKSALHGRNDSFASREVSLAPVPSTKKKKKQRIKQEIPIVPRYIYDRVWNYIKSLRCTKKQAFVRMVCRYWSLKRSKRQGAPLLKRLHLEPWTASAATTRDATDLEREQRLELILQLRNDLEKVRNMVELVRKREIEKLRRAQLFKEVIDAVIFPQTGLFRAALREIQK
jgi:NuA3 HAT complex component NTO1